MVRGAESALPRAGRLPRCRVSGIFLLEFFDLEPLQAHGFLGVESCFSPDRRDLLGNGVQARNIGQHQPASPVLGSENSPVTGGIEVIHGIDPLRRTEDADFDDKARQFAGGHRAGTGSRGRRHWRRCGGFPRSGWRRWERWCRCSRAGFRSFSPGSSRKPRSAGAGIYSPGYRVPFRPAIAPSAGLWQSRAELRRRRDYLAA